MENKLKLREIIKNSKECLNRALRNLKIIVDAQPKVADGTFFDALTHYRDIRKIVAENDLLNEDEIGKCDAVCHIYSMG